MKSTSCGWEQLLIKILLFRDFENLTRLQQVQTDTEKRDESNL